MYVRHRFSGIIQYQSLKILRHYLLASLQNPPIPQTALYAPMPFEPPACERGHGTDCGKSRERKWKKPASCACTKEQAFSSDERRQPGTAKSGSSLLSLYTTYVRERASAGKGACALPPSSVFLSFCRRNLPLRLCNRIFIACYCEKRYTDSERRSIK